MHFAMNGIFMNFAREMGKIRFHILALITIAIWGATFVSTKTLIGAGLTPSLIFFIRFTIAYIGIWFFERKPALLSKSLKDEIIFLLLGITGGSVYFLTENTALECTQACNVSFLVCTAPLFTLLLNIAARKLGKGKFSSGQENIRVNGLLITATLLTFIGMTIVIFGETKLHLSPKGDLLALGAALCWAIYSILMGNVSSRYGSVFVTRKIFFYGLVTILPVILTSQTFPRGILSQPIVIWNLLFLSIIASLACFLVWNRVMAEIGNVTSTNYVYLNPFFTLVIATLILGESMSLLEILGSVAIVAGVILAGKSVRQGQI